MNINIAKTVSAVLLFGAMALPAMVQASPDNNVNQRFAEQHQRILQGDRTGQLTFAERRRLAFNEERIRNEARRDRFFHEGRLTAREHFRVEKQLNRTSGSIYRLKHNDRTL